MQSFLLDHNRLVSTPTTSTPSKANNNHFHLGTTATTVAQRTNAHQNVSLLAKSNNLTSATLKTSPLANGLQRANSACPVSSPQLEQLAAKTTTTIAETLPQHNDTDNSCSNGSDVSPVASVAAARVSVAVECSVETATKAIGAHLGCGGGDQCDNSKGVEALGVLLQYLVFRVSIQYKNTKQTQNTKPRNHNKTFWHRHSPTALQCHNEPANA